MTTSSRGLKVALYVHCYYPRHYFGTEAFTAAVARELKALGHHPTVISATFDGEPAQKALVEESEWDGVPVVSIDKNVLPGRTMRESFDQPALRGVHERILRKLAPDVVHVMHVINHTTAAIEAAKALGLPMVATLTDFFGVCVNNRLEAADGSLCLGPSPSRANCMACYVKAAGERPDPSTAARLLNAPGIRPAAARLMALAGRWRAGHPSFAPAAIAERPAVLRAAMSNYSHAFALTRFLKEAYERNGFPVPISLLHTGVDIDRSPKPARAPGAPVEIAYAGQIVRHKGVHLLVEALRRANRPNLRLTVWGPLDQHPPYVEELRRLASGLDVRFPGAFAPARTAEIMAAADVLAIPSTWYENAPQSLLQALATHTPVVGSDVLGITEFLEDGVNGFAFRRGDAGALASVLARFADDPALAARMSARTDYPRTWAATAADLLPAYERALAGTPVLAPGGAMS